MCITITIYYCCHYPSLSKPISQQTIVQLYKTNAQLLASMLGLMLKRWSVSTEELGLHVCVVDGVDAGLDVGTLVGVDRGKWRG